MHPHGARAGALNWLRSSRDADLLCFLSDLACGAARIPTLTQWVGSLCRWCHQKLDPPSLPPASASGTHWRPPLARPGNLFRVTTVGNSALLSDFKLLMLMLYLFIFLKNVHTLKQRKQTLVKGSVFLSERLKSELKTEFLSLLLRSHGDR